MYINFVGISIDFDIEFLIEKWGYACTDHSHPSKLGNYIHHPPPPPPELRSLLCLGCLSPLICQYY